jgi:CheY-like chemotaxis protein
VKTILLLDDDPSVVTLYRLVLKPMGYTLLESTTVNEAFCWHFQTEHIDLLIADVKLSVRSGIHAAFQLKTWIPDLKIIIISGDPPQIWSAWQRAEFRQIPIDCVAVLQKPFFPANLLAAVANLLGRPAIKTAPELVLAAEC